MFAFLIASPGYFNDELQLGQLFEISGAYWFVHAALSYIIESFGKIAQWQAVKNRMQQFYTQLIQAQRLPPATSFHSANTLITKEHVLINKLTFELSAGKSLLITGPSGCGKTTLLQTLAGVWPYFAGKVSCPPAGSVLFLPQKPYLPIGSLRAAILYPHSHHRITDEKLKEALHICKLDSLLPCLDIETDWSKSLSLGELQRLSLTRAILYQPQWIFLDETTSCLDTSMEAEIYQVLREKLPTSALISIGHRDTLKTYHRLILKLSNTSDWSCSEQMQQQKM